MLNVNKLREFNVFEKIFDKCNDGINVVNLKGEIVYVNSVSAEYADMAPEDMIGHFISDFYPDAVLLNVLQDRNIILDKKIHYVANKRYVVSSYPIYIQNRFVGAFSVFRDIQEMDELNSKIKYLELQINLNTTEDDLNSVIGNEGSLEDVLVKARKSIGSLGGPRHSIIIGESGTGKTMLANLIYSYGKEIGVLNKDAPFIEVNCAQFTNSDIAAMEIFGSEEGAYTGAKKRKGLLERANGGVLFLDEAHALEEYQTLLLKAVESGKFQRLGGAREISVDVIIIAASTRNLQEELLPELYQRLAQYELYLPSFDERSDDEKEHLFNYFVNRYEEAVKRSHNIKYKAEFSKEAKEWLFMYKYPRNIRQFRDFINYSIDQASPLISDIGNKKEITVKIELKHLPFDVTHVDEEVINENMQNSNYITDDIGDTIIELSNSGLGPRRIANRLQEMGHDIKYYQVAYYLQKCNN
ncbi:MAG: sigma 54-interacting transcriptional regulator [Tissierellia bacterium]|nr:sigma 54-interacting transcriptional regulator [Tissierellia bacterium]